MVGHTFYALAWVSFGLVHSLLAHDGVQARLRPWLGARYRLTYNIIAAVHLALVAAIGHWALGAADHLDLPDGAVAALWSIHIIGWAVLLGAGGGYDLGRFSGLTQIRRARAGLDWEAENEPLRIDGVHRWVRHPLYAGAYLILWGAAQTPLGLATAVWGSLYLAIGTRFEERKLLRLYGGAYAEYRRRVPALIPWRGRAI